MEDVDHYLKAHRDHLAELYAAGDSIMSGPQTPRVGDVIVMRADNSSTVDTIIAQDRFNINGIGGKSIDEIKRAY